ncbi:signal peptidase I [Gammaproteobacteria bacterium]|mgnify:FL=1|nr:signal peptidase I [Gammaproteobacteria bacterium]
MDIDFSLVLVCLVAICGGIWFLDALLVKGGRIRAAEAFAARASKDLRLTEEQVEQELERLSREPIVTEYAKSFFPVLLFVLTLRSFLFEPYQVPTGSMIPTIKIGDFILVNKFAYGLRLPVLGTKILDVGEPQRGEIMVFIPPHVNQYFIKRVIGLPGDTIRYENQRLSVNGELVPEEFVSSVSVDTGIGPLDGVLNSATYNGVTHATQHIPGVNSSRGRSSWIVPAGHYFMIGDNRENSADSRVWGAVPEENVVGKAIAIWLHKDPGLNLPSFENNTFFPQPE